MIRTKTEPKDPVIFGDYKWLIKVLYLAGICGSIYSGMTEWNGFKSDELAQTFPVLYPVIGILLIESMRVIAPALFLTISRLIKKFEWKRIPVVLILTALVGGLVYLSIVKSEDGIVHKAENKYAFNDSIDVDSSKYKMLCEVCNRKWQSDSLSASTKAKAEFGDELYQEAKAKRAANQRISEIKHSTATWAVKTVKQMSNVAQTALGNIKEIETQINIAINDSLNVAKSQYTACLANANDTLLYYTNLAENSYTSAKTTNEVKKNKKIERNYFLMCLGVIFIILHAMAEQWLFHVSGVEVIYNFNATDKGIGFKEKASAILTVHAQNLGNFILGILSLGYELSVNNDELVIKERNKSAKDNSDKWWQVFKRKKERKRLDKELKRAKEIEDIELKKAEIEAEKQRLKHEQNLQAAKIEADRLKQLAQIEAKRTEIELAQIEARKAATTAELAAKQEIELAKIAAENEQKRLKAESEAKIRAIAAEQQAKQEAAKRALEQQEIEAARQQEIEKMRVQQQEIEAARQQLILQQQETAKQQQLLDEANKVAAEKQEKATTGQQVKRDLATAMKTVNAKNATGNNLEVLEIQQVVDEMFDSNITDGKLVIGRKFNTAVGNYYKRWQSATERLKGDLSVARQQQVEKGLEDNKNKFEYAVDKAANLNVEIKVKGGKVEIDYMDKD